MNSNVYVWYSKGSEDSGKVFAKLLGTEQHGTLPPKDFSGVLVCYGAVPGDKFKWSERNIRFIFNDPRQTRKHHDRAAMFKTLAAAGINVPKIFALKDLATISAACEKLGTTSVQGLSVFKAGGSDAMWIHTANEFANAKSVVPKDAKPEVAKTRGMVYASTPEFLSEKRTRMFIVDGAFVCATARGNGNHVEFAKMAASEQTAEANKESAEKLIRYLLENGFVDPAKAYWQVFNAVSPEMTTAAVSAAKALGLDFCAVDLVQEGAKVTVLNVVSTPGIATTEMSAIHGPIQDALKLWMKRAHRTAKEIIAELAKEASEEEAEEIVTKLRSMKAETAKAG
jgi:hypothetical protein